MKPAIPLLKETYSRWSDRNAPRLGASVAFYSILSFAPLLVLVTAIIGLALGNESAHATLVGEAQQLIGPHGAKTVESLLKNAQKPASGTFASIVAFVTLLFGASGVFTELQAALDIMWDATQQQASGFIGLIKQRLFSFGMVLSVGFLLLVSLLISAALSFVGHSFANLIPVPTFLLQIINFLLSFVVVTALFALMFRYVPSVRVGWRNVIIGAIGTALLFTIGKFLLGIYLGKAGVGSTYGAAGSLVAVVVWIYYSAQIFFFGAEFTRVYADAQHPQAATETMPKGAAHAEVPNPGPEHVSVEKPKAMAAAAGFPSISTTHAPQSPTPTRPDIPAVTQPAPSPAIRPATTITPSSEPASRTPTRASRRPATKPRLLAATVIGFVLGSLFSAKTSRHV